MSIFVNDLQKSTTKMIINFSIQNFYSIKDKITLSFEATSSTDLEEYYIIEPIPKLRLLKLALIYGANASGKTNILLALEHLRDLVLEPFNTKTKTFSFYPFLFDTETPHQNTVFELSFVQNKTKYDYRVELNKQAIVSESLHFYQPRKALVYSRTTDSEKQLTSIDFGSKIKINSEFQTILEANTLWNNTVLGGFLKTNIEIPIFVEIMEWFGGTLANLVTSDKDLFAFISDKIDNNEIDKNNVVSFLTKADFKIKKITIKREKKDTKDLLSILSKKLYEDVLFHHEIKKEQRSETYELPYNLESQGTQRYYQFSGLLDLAIRNETILSIDEIAASINPDLLKHFLLTFLANTKTAQLIATTHSRELLMEKDIIRNDAIWFTEKQENGSTDLYALTDFDSSVIRNTSSIYNAYKIGKLGAKPNLQDHYISTENG